MHGHWGYYMGEMCHHVGMDVLPVIMEVMMNLQVRTKAFMGQHDAVAACPRDVTTGEEEALMMDEDSQVIHSRSLRLNHVGTYGGCLWFLSCRHLWRRSMMYSD